MPALSDLRGLRYPDEYVVRMFFKEGLHGNHGRVLELGCGSGNNLMLFQGFGWEVTGIDISEESLADARHNLGDVDQKVSLHRSDLAREFPNLEGDFDVIILPSVNYYMSRACFVKILVQCGLLLKPDGLFYVRSRTCNDWRYGRGHEVEPNGFMLQCTETGEKGLLNVFYERNELIDAIGLHMCALRNLQVLSVRYENPQSGIVISNDDLVLWGRK